jgi:acetyl-CoA carboxylase biotin carboxylase subunit
MFRKILVANRGEIAGRIIKTLNILGIKSVVVFSEADKKAPYLKEATESMCIGPAPARESYLCEEALLNAARVTDCEAIHPGYGFLSENARFAVRCAQQKLTFIGPSPELLSLMGDKAKARSTMASLGVPVLRGSEGIVSTLAQAEHIARELGYPVLLKARAGGGGKGMRLVEHEKDLKAAWNDAKREANGAFGDDELYVEKFVKNARHIEFQVLGDSYGEIIILGERECSLQRKNQKLLEEAPASNFSDDQRQKIYELIKKALKKLKYSNAGTMEFLLGHDGQLYFMEMNTRLQVEHPVTELITGLDIIEWQIRVAANNKLGFCQEDIKILGHALECRINAEDPTQNFLPSPGLIDKLVLPESSLKGPVRIDTYIEPGYSVVPFYDSMLAKVITFGATRTAALELMRQTLDQIRIDGIKTTLDFHKAILREPGFQEGFYDCSFIEKNMNKLCRI